MGAGTREQATRTTNHFQGLHRPCFVARVVCSYVLHLDEVGEGDIGM